jgi:hypothetical protein
MMDNVKKYAAVGAILLLGSFVAMAANVKQETLGPSGQGDWQWTVPANGRTNMYMTTNGITVLRIYGRLIDDTMLDTDIVTNVLADGMSLPAVDCYAATNFNGTNLVVATVGLDKMMSASVGNLQIIAGSVSNSALGLGCISNKNLIASSITTTNIIDGAVTLADMAADSVGNLQVIAGSISNANIGAGAAIVGSKIASGQSGITITNMAESSVGSLQYVAGSISNASVGAGAAIAMSKLATNHVRSANNTLMVDRGNAVCWTGLTYTQTFHTAFAEAPEVMVRYTADGGNTNMVLTVVSNQFTVAAITNFSWIAVGWTSP